VVSGGLGFVGVDQVAEFLGGLEVGDALGGDFDALAGFGVAPDAGVALADAEGAKAANFDLVSALQGAMTEPKMVSTITSPSRRVRSPRPVTFSTRSAFVMSSRPPLTSITGFCFRKRQKNEPPTELRPLLINKMGKKRRAGPGGVEAQIGL
jgi:hypothetical protein